MYYKLNESIFDFIKRVNSKKEDENFKEKYFTHFAAHVYSKWFFYNSILKPNYSYNDYLTTMKESLKNSSSIYSKQWLKVADLNERSFKKLLLEKESIYFSPHFKFIIKDENVYVSIKTPCAKTLKWFKEEFLDNKEVFEIKSENTFNFIFDFKLQYRTCLNEISLSECLEMDLLDEVNETIYDENIEKLMTDDEKQTRSGYKSGLKRILGDTKLTTELKKLIKEDTIDRIENNLEKPVFSIILNGFKNKG